MTRPHCRLSTVNCQQPVRVAKPSRRRNHEGTKTQRRLEPQRRKGRKDIAHEDIALFGHGFTRIGRVGVDCVITTDGPGRSTEPGANSPAHLRTQWGINFSAVLVAPASRGRCDRSSSSPRHRRRGLPGRSSERSLDACAISAGANSQQRCMAFFAVQLAIRSPFATTWRAVIPRPPTMKTKNQKPKTLNSQL